MSAAENTERRSSLQNTILEQLHDPLRLRIVLTLLMLAIGYWGVYTPLRQNIVSTKSKLAETRTQLELAHDVEQLRVQFQEVQKRLPKQTDPKEWVQFMLNSIQKLPVTLNSIKCDASRDLGPYKAVVFQLEISASFSELDQFLTWVELNRRFFRIDNINIGMGNDKTNPALNVKLTILGIMG